MNILLVAYYFPPINCAGSVRPAQMARWLRQCGHTVFVLTHGYGREGPPQPGIIRVHDPAFTRAHRGAAFWRWAFWRGRAELQNSCGRYASIFSPWKQAVLEQAEAIGRASRPDLVLATYPPLEALEAGLELARRLRVPLVSDFRDGLMFRPIEEKRLRAHASVREKYRRTEAAVAAASALIVAVTPVLRDYFLDAYPGSRCHTVFNGYDPQEWLDLPSLPPAGGTVRIVHTGRFALSDSATDIAPFLAALGRPGSGQDFPPFHLHLIGEYSAHERSLLKGLVAAGRATIHPLADRRQTLAWQKAADLLLLITRPGVRSGIPLKLFEYAFSGRPVLALSDDTEIRRLVDECGIGWSLSPLATPEIAGLLERLRTDPGFKASLQRRPDAIRAFCWEEQMTGLNGLLASLPAASPGH